jgi:hypothetical protein
MSNIYNDQIMDGIILDVDSMSDMDVMSNLNIVNVYKVSKFTGDDVHGANIIDYARSVLVSQMWDEVLVWI